MFWSQLSAWQTGLAELAGQTGLTITVCQLPLGTSRWNAVDHRVRAQFRVTGHAGRAIRHEVALDVVANPAASGPTSQPVAVPRGELPVLAGLGRTGGTVVGHTWHGEWNYTIDPAISGTIGKLT